MLKLHGRQFVVGPEAVMAAPDWVQSALPGGRVLSRCRELPAQSARDRDGAEWTLLGTAWAVPAPVEQIARAATSEVALIARRWAGRWVLIGDDRVHMDAAGLLGCFFRDGWISSSAALVARGEPRARHPIWHEVGIDWPPPPCSLYASVHRLLASQVLRFDGTIEHRPLLLHPAPRDHASVLDELERHLRDVVTAASRMGTVHVPLSGGWDSRLILAACCAEGVHAHAYTQGYFGMTRADRDLPALIARAAGVEHSFIDPSPARAERFNVIDAHSSGHYMGADRDFIARSQWDWIGEDDVILRGSGFEIGRCGWARLIHPLDRPEYAELGARERAELVLRSTRERDAWKREALVDWARWCDRHPEPIDWRERLFWEQRVGGWVSAVEQALDLLPGRRGHVANSHRFYELVLSLPEEARRASLHHRDLFRRLAPDLLRFPFNPPDPFPLRLRRKALRRLNAWYHRLALAG